MPIQKITITSRDGTTNVYRFEGITESEAKEIARLALTDPVNQTAAVNLKSSLKTTEIGYKLGVTDPMGHSLIKASQLLGIKPTAISSARAYSGTPPAPSQIETVIHRDPDTLLFSGKSPPVVTIPLRTITGPQLQELSAERSLFLTLPEMETIQTHYHRLKRDPTDVELETFAQTWSEHCAHKTFKAILVDEAGREKPPLMTRIRETSQKYFASAGVVSAFSDNAGGIGFDHTLAVIGKGETHNSPVAIEPYAGSLTKNGGLYRDIAGTGKGGENLVSFMVNNFALPSDTPQPGSLLPKTLLLNNSRGERDYGNPMGIPTHGINLHFHPGFGPKPTSLGVAIGLIPKSQVRKGKPQAGDLIVTVGGKTGRDGLHGATFSSAEMTELTHTSHAAAVQLGDPIVERAMFDALIFAREAKLIRALTDCGAGGYASAIGEMAEGLGAQVDLDQIPQKYSGLAAWEKWLSESQERMVVCLPPKHWPAFQKICRRFDTSATILGSFCSSKKLKLIQGGKTVADIDLQFLHHGLPQRKMQMENRFQLMPAALKVLAHLNLCSKEIMLRQYDQTVQAMSVLAPFVGVSQDVSSEGSILAPLLSGKSGVAVSHSLNPALMALDPYWGSIWTLSQAAAKFTAIGGDIHQAAGIDNFIWPFPDPTSLAGLDASVDGLCAVMDALHLPMVSGKDSLSSTYRGPKGEVIKAPPTLNITIFGKIADIGKSVSCDFKHTGSVICLIGKLDLEHLGGSVYFQTLGLTGGIPRVDLKQLPKTLSAVSKAIRQRQILSARAVGEGGLLTALAQMCFGGGCGAQIQLDSFGSHRPDEILFNETAGTFLLEVKDKTTVRRICGGLPHVFLGSTIPEPEIRASGKIKFDSLDLKQLKAAWQAPFKDLGI